MIVPLAFFNINRDSYTYSEGRKYDKLNVMSQKWNNNFEIGHSEIDHHHEEVFEVTTMLDFAIENNDRSELNKIIKYLEHYVVDHFNEEESLMQKHNFNGYHDHKDEHDIFTDLVKELRRLYDENIHTTHIILKIRKFTDQLMHHIITTDSKMSGLH